MHDEWIKTEPIRNNINLDGFVVMPNHIREIIDKNPIVGANRDSPLLRNKIGINNSFYKSKFESPSNNLGAIIRGYKSP